MVRPVNPAEPPHSGELAALAAAPVNDAAFKSAAAAALLSSLRPASQRTSQRPRSENAAGPTALGYNTEQSTFHFRQVPLAPLLAMSSLRCAAPTFQSVSPAIIGTPCKQPCAHDTSSARMSAAQLRSRDLERIQRVFERSPAIAIYVNFP